MLMVQFLRFQLETLLPVTLSLNLAKSDIKDTLKNSKKPSPSSPV
jgi:hypothetical protein